MSNTHGYIYLIENNINDKLYVGQTTNPKKREYTHFSTSGSRCYALQNAIKKHHVENFYFILLESCDSKESLDVREKHWISRLDTIAPNGYNLKSGGSRGIVSEETRSRMSSSQKGRVISESHRKKISESWNKRERCLSEETKNKIRTSLKESKGNLGWSLGTQLPEPQKKKISKSLKAYYKLHPPCPRDRCARGPAYLITSSGRKRCRICENLQQRKRRFNRKLTSSG